MLSPDVLVIGAGAIGAAVAYYLGTLGYGVVVVDRSGPASGASGASEGIVGSVAKRTLGLVTSLVTESFRMFPLLGDELGCDIEFVQKGGLMVIDHEDHLEILERFVRKKRGAGLPVELLDRKSALALEPMLSASLVGAVWTPEQGVVNPLRLTQGYLRAGRRARLDVVFGEAVSAIELRTDRVVAVQTPNRRITPGVVVDAAGSEAASVAQLAGVSVEIIPKRAHMMASEALPAGTLRTTVYNARNVIGGLRPDTLEFEDARTPAPAADEGCLTDRPGTWELSSFTQTKSGNVLFCGGFGFVGALRTVDPRVLNVMARNISTVMPKLGDVSIIRSWAGLEPCTSDNLPIIGRAPSLKNFYIAAGHGNAGVMMAPATGMLLANLIASRPTRFSLDAATPARFATVAAQAGTSAAATSRGFA